MAATARVLEDYNAGRLPGSCGSANRLPIANAGPDQTPIVGSVVTLNASASVDPDGNALTFAWSFVSKPATSAAALSDSTIVMPTFLADVPGTYELRLVVNDSSVDSAPDTVQVSTLNSRPVANAGPDQTSRVTNIVQVDGSASGDADGDALTFAWSLVSIPSGSGATLSDPAAINPSFTIDAAGDFVVQLVVSDGVASSFSDSVTISTVNSLPTANAGADTTGFVGNTLTLNGAGSTDVDGDGLTFSWSFVTKPAGSVAALSDDTSVTPQFVIDIIGTYVAQLVVNDGTADSVPDTVVVSTLNTRPVAQAGGDQVLVVGGTAQLDGTGSTDIDGNILSFHWSLTTQPLGSASSLSDPNAVNPTFPIDLAGTYIAQLIVNDGALDSAPDTVTIATQHQNAPPLADPGLDQTVVAGAIVQLDGTASSDPEGDPLTFTWALLSKPVGSTAALSEATIASPVFVADRAGAYVAQLIVNDGALNSVPRNVTISTQNLVPIAVAGPDQIVATNATVQLDGGGSNDPEGTPLEYSWSFLSQPAGSSATFSDPALANPTLVADREGIYLAQLIVGDGALVSTPDAVMITVQNGADLRVVFIFDVPATPPVGAQVIAFIQVANDGPADTTGVTASFQIPAGYTIASENVMRGTYDAATGIWTIGSLPVSETAGLALALIVNSTGTHDLTATITESSAPDPDPGNNTITALVTPAGDADLRIALTNPPSGTRAVGSSVTLDLQIINDGPSGTTGVTAGFLVPVGYTVDSVNAQVGNYSVATGDWTIGAMSTGSLARLILSATVNATGPLGLVATITNSAQSDPNPANNTTAAPPVNRPPVANAGTDQNVATNSTVTLSGALSSDADGGGFAFQWAFALRPANSTAALVGATTAAPSFTPDLPGPYNVRLIVTDSLATSAPDFVAITATGLSRPPVISSTPITVGAVGSPYRYEVEAIDLDAGHTLTFSLTTAPAGMTVDATSGVIDWTPAGTQGGPQEVLVRVQDQHGLSASQSFAVQVSSASNHAPVAADDAFEARVSESLSVNSPGTLGNDVDADGHRLTATLVRRPANGTLNFNADGSFIYTPQSLREGDVVALSDNVNLASRLPGVTVRVSSSRLSADSCGDARCAIDDELNTSWLTDFGDGASVGANPFFEVVFPQDVTVTQLQLMGHRNRFLVSSQNVEAGRFQLFAADDTVLFDSGIVSIPAPSRDVLLTIPNLAGVRRVRFSDAADGAAGNVGFAELKVIGTALVRRDRVEAEKNLVHLLPATVLASSSIAFNVAENAIDDNVGTNWYGTSTGDFLEVIFPLDVTVTEVKVANPGARPDGFGTSNTINCTGAFTLYDLSDTLLFDSGVVNTPSGNINSGVTFSLSVPSVAGVRRLRYTSVDCTGSFTPPGFSEVTVFGSTALTTPAPAFSVSKKLQALLGRQVHSTTVVANLTDDNGDGAIDQHDVPDIVVPVETPGDQLTGEIKVLSGDDGRELFTLGGPNLVSPWAEVAVGDIDADRIPDIIAVHSDGTHLIAFDTVGAGRVKWISDPNPMPSFTVGGSPLVGGAVSIAHLDGTGRASVVVGASVFTFEGRLVGDGRSLGGTTGGTNLRSAISAIADVDLDGVPEIIAGPTAYRVVNGALAKVWQRTDRPDGYASIGNFDDDPEPEIAIAADGLIYILNHDGSDAELWNPPTHAPLAIPVESQGGAPPAAGQAGPPLVVDVDGNGIPEIGIATSSAYILFNRDGSVRWKSAISDHSSHSTGGTAFDFDGDGEVEIVYRDEQFLRIFRGRDGILLAKTDVGSSTWAEEPVVVDVDNDGHADIVVSSDRFFGSAATGVYVFQDVANQWVRTRRIWNQHSYHITNVNEDGTIPLVETSNWLVPGLNNYRVNAFIPGETPDEADSFTYVATDGVLQSNVATVRISVRTPNGPPEITSTPVTSAASGVPYSYAAQATDPDPGDILTFSLPTAPAGMTIDPSSGLLQWTPTVAQLGLLDVVVKVADVHGLFALQAYSVQSASPLSVPNVVGQSQTAGTAAITSAGFASGSIGTRHSPTAPADSVISQNPVGGTLAAPGEPVSLVVSLGPAPAGTVPGIVGQIQGAAQADVVAAGFVVGAVVGQNSSTTPLGIVLSQSPAAGTVATTGSAIDIVVSLGPPPGELDVDGDGFTGNRGDCNDNNAAIHPGAFDVDGDGIDQNCNGVDSIAGDSTVPVALIESPAEDAEITMPIDIVGTATDANLLRYTLSLERINDTSITPLATGTAAVVSGIVGRLDPTLLENGLYRVRLVAEDVNGQSGIDERVYRVSGEAKVGLMALAFVDLQVPVAGIPITVVRSYDSRVKTQRDFGIGWNLQVKTGSYQNNRRPGDAWIVATGGGPFGLPCAVVTETRSHITDVRVSDREFYMFRPRLANLAAVVGGCVGKVSFELVGGTTTGATLAVLGNASIIYTSGGVVTEFDGSADTGLIFDPRRVRLTTLDGRAIDFDRALGVTRIQDSNGNALVITASGITHSSGKSIAFSRDSLGRLIAITDPAANRLGYGYDKDGDLTEFVDQLGNRTTFSYDTRHNLLEIRDPLGNRAVRSEYDSEGRLVAVVDADDNRIELAHDLAGRQETVRDRLGRVIRHEYDALGNITGTTDALGRRHEFTYDGRGNNLTETDPLGRTRQMTYDANGNALTRTDFDGNQTTYTFNLRGQLMTTTDPTGRTATNRYDANGSLIKETDGAGGATEYALDRSGNPVSVRDPLGSTTTYAYDPAGNHTLVADAQGATRTFAYDPVGNPLTSSDLRTVGGSIQQLITQFRYDAAGQVSQQTNPAGEETRFSYDSFGALTEITDPAGVTTKLEFDTRGQLLRFNFADGSSETYTHDAEGRQTSKTNRDGFITRFERPLVTTPAGMVERLVTVYPDATTRILEPDVVGRPALLIDELGNTSSYEYERNVKRVTDPLGHMTTHRLDGAGRPSELVDALNHTWRIEYDGAGRRIRTIHPDGDSRTVTYDAAGRKTTERDEAGATSTFGYDSRGRLVRVIDPAGATTLYEYDEVGNLVRQTDASGRTTAMEYDAAGRLTRRRRPLGQVETLAYDPAGNLVAHTDFNGRTTTLAYDANYRLIGKNLPDGSVVTYAYTHEGRRIRAEGDTFVYDARGRVLEDRKASGEVISYTYDSAGNRTSVTTPAGTVQYTFDQLNRMATVIDAVGTTTYSYDAVGNLASTGTPNQVTTAYTYDNRNRLTQVVTTGPGGVIASYAYTLDTSGKRTRVLEAGPNTMSRTVDYTYDAVGRLTRERIDAPGALFDRDVTYSYDAVGNRLQMTTVSSTETADVVYTYDANHRLLTESTSVTTAMLPDAPFRLAPTALLYLPASAAFLALIVVAGRRRNEAVSWHGCARTVAVCELVAVLAILPPLADLAHAAAMDASAVQQPSSVLTYSYDSNGNVLTRSTGLLTDTYTYDAENRLMTADVQIGPVSNRHFVSYTYDADGSRNSRTVDGTTTTFLVDNSGDLARALLETTDSEIVRYTYGHDLIGQARPGIGARFYHYDGQHSTRQLTDAAGTVTDTYDYDAFGVQLFAQGGTPNDFRYTGQQFDPSIGFYYLRARYYAQATGRFLTGDPLQGSIFDPMSLHRYLYAAADPVNKWDPSGEQSMLQLAQSFAIHSLLLSVRIGVPILNSIGSVIGRNLGAELVKRFTTRFAARLGKQLVDRILIRAKLPLDRPVRAAMQQLDENMAKQGLEWIATGTVKKAVPGTSKQILRILIFLAVGEEAKAAEDSQGLEPQNDDERLAVSAIAEFLVDESPFVHPRFKRVFDAFYRLIAALL